MSTALIISTVELSKYMHDEGKICIVGRKKSLKQLTKKVAIKSSVDFMSLFQYYLLTLFFNAPIWGNKAYMIFLEVRRIFLKYT